MTHSELKARAVIGVDLYHEGRITRPEAFRLETDAVLGRDTGPIKFEENTDHEELLADDEEYRRRFEQWKAEDGSIATNPPKP
jgi:hypothetical protein